MDEGIFIGYLWEKKHFFFFLTFGKLKIYFRKNGGRIKLRLISLRQYSIIAIQTIRNSTVLRTREILTDVENQPELYAPAVCYFFATKQNPRGSGDVQELLHNINQIGIKTQNDFFNWIEKHSEEGRNRDLLDFVSGFLNFNEERDQTEVKNKCRYFVKKIHDERGISYYRMCKDVGIHPGNLHAFIQQGKNDRLSWGKCLKLLNYLNKES